MTYIRKMKDWSEKIYYTEDEFFDIFEKKIKKSSEELLIEMIEMKKEKENKINNEIKINSLQYA